MHHSELGLCAHFGIEPILPRIRHLLMQSCVHYACSLFVVCLLPSQAWLWSLSSFFFFCLMGRWLVGRTCQRRAGKAVHTFAPDRAVYAFVTHSVLLRTASIKSMIIYIYNVLQA